MPVFSVAGGSYADAQTVTISDATPGATIYYTTNGTYPSTYSTQYSAPITVSSSEIVVAVAVATGYTNSKWAIGRYFIGSSSSSFIYTVAGTGSWGYSGDGGSATFAQLSDATGVAVDGSGNVYFVDPGNYVVRKVAATTGIITTFAGTGVSAHTGDNGPATNAGLWTPSSIAVDPTGNVYIGETGDMVVRKVDLSGVITTYAGGGTGAPGSATGATFYGLTGVTCDIQGNLYIVEGVDVLKVTAATGTITNLAGYSGSNYAQFGYLAAIAVDNGQNVYVADSVYSVVRKIDRSGNVTVIAGSLYGGRGGDGGPATSAGLYYPQGLATDGAGNLYISDSANYEIRKVNLQSGMITDYAGILHDPYAAGADGDPSTSAALSYPQGIASDASGNVYFADGPRIRKVTAPGTPPTSAAAAPVFSVAEGTYATPQTLTITDTTPGAEIYVSIGGAAPSTGGEGFHGPIDVTGTATVQAIAVAPGYLSSTLAKSAYTITTPPTSLISTVAGNNTFGYSGIGGPATSAQLNAPQAVTLDAGGNLYIADVQNNAVWMVSAGSGNIAVVAGNGTSGYTGDGGQATAAELSSPSGVAVDKAGNLFIADTRNNRIREVAAGTGIITTIAGPGKRGTLGDGGPASAASIVYPLALLLDPAGNLYIADTDDTRVRMIAAGTGIITTVAGGSTSQTTSPGDGGPATSAYLFPVALALDKAGDLYIADLNYGLVRRVDAKTGIITSIAGGGKPGPNADGILATDARINPQGLAVDASGNIYFSDYVDYTVKKIDPATGILTTAAGNGYYGFGGDGSAATIASLSAPTGLAFDSAGSLYIADSANHVIRKVAFPGPAATPVISLAAGSYSGPQTVTITDSTANATIYYTTDGGAPTTASSVYSAAITVSSSETLQAIAVAAGFTESAVAKAAYTITKVTPAIALSSSANPGFVSDPVTFTATLTVSAGTPSGTVSFYDGTSLLGTGTVNSGAATYSTSALTTGTHAITAVYSGDGNFATITSAALTETIEDFTFTTPSGGSTSATASAGGQASYTLAVTPPTGSTSGGAITFTVTGLPTGATATFSPSTVPAKSGPTNVTLTVNLPSKAEAQPLRLFGGGAASLALALMLFPFAGMLRSGSRRLKGTLCLLVLGISGAALTAALSGCGGGGGSTPAPAPNPQTYTLTVTAASGSLSHSTTLTLTVQ